MPMGRKNDRIESIESAVLTREVIKTGPVGFESAILTNMNSK